MGNHLKPLDNGKREENNSQLIYVQEEDNMNVS